MAIDPLMVPYMQKALGGGDPLTDQGVRELFQKYNPMQSGMMQAGGGARGPAMPTLAANLGAGQSALAP